MLIPVSSVPKAKMPRVKKWVKPSQKLFLTGNGIICARHPVAEIDVALTPYVLSLSAGMEGYHPPTQVHEFIHGGTEGGNN